MAFITSAQAGDWSDTATWNTGTVPTADDFVYIDHAVTISTSITAGTISIREGSLTVADSYDFSTQISCTAGSWFLYRRLNDTRRVNLDGVLLKGHYPVIVSWGNPSDDGFPHYGNGGIYQSNTLDVIITDPGYIGTQARLQDITPEGCGQAYARKLGNSVRYLTVTVRIRASKPQWLGRLYRMAEGPFQVLLVTDRTLIKGYIETIVPDQSAVGTEYISVKVTVAEGL